MSVMLLAVVFIIIAIAIVFKKMSEISSLNEEWMRAAGSLGLSFTKAAGMLDAPKLNGSVNGFPVSVSVVLERRQNGLQPCTTYAVELPPEANIEKLLDKAAARIDSVRTGHPLIDKALAAGGFDRAKLRDMLSDAKDAALAKFAKSFPRLSVSDSRAVCKFEGVDGDAGLIAARLAQLLCLARALSWREDNVRDGMPCEDDKSGSPLNLEEIPSVAELNPQTAPAAPLFPPPPPPPAFARAAVESVEKKKEKPFVPASQPFSAKPASFSRAATDAKPGTDAELATDAKLATNAKLATEAKEAIKSKLATVSSAPQQAASQEELARGVDKASCERSPEPLAKALFAANFPGQAEKTLFEKVKGGKVEWSGVLKSAQEYGMDFNFGGGAGTKAVFELCELPVGGSSIMKNRIKAVVQLPKDAAAKLKGRTGQTIGFSGSLFKFEGVAKEIYLSDGSTKE